MKLGLKGLELIKSFEALRLEPYLDPVGIPTIGWGHTLGVRLEQGPATLEQCEVWLEGDVSDAERGVNRFVKVELTQNQFDALVSFVYNVGVGNFEISTMLKKLNQGNYLGASKEFSKWVHAKGKRLRGLEIRRQAEAELFLS